MARAVNGSYLNDYVEEAKLTLTPDDTAFAVPLKH
jgi:hypothetical protein